MNTTPLLTRHRVLMLVLIFVGLGSMYMIFYSANLHEFGDSQYLYNITASLVRYGDTLFDLAAYNWPARSDNTFYAENLYPLYYYREDLTSVTLATPLYWLAFNTPGIGLLHTVWLFNVFVCAAVGALMFLYALALGYSERTAVIAALTLGLATIVLPYSKTFLQEPISLLITFTLAFVLERWRASRYRWHWLLLIVPLVWGFSNAKLSSVAALPGVLCVALPALGVSPVFWRRFSAAVFLLLAAFAVYTAFNDVRPLLTWAAAPIANLYLPQLNGYLYQFIDNPYITIAVRTYVFSIGASIWATSPSTLLAIPGTALLLRKLQMRYVWVSLLVLFGYIFGYAVFRGEAWYGSVTYPPRFLVPAVPFLMLLALPVIEHMVNRKGAKDVQSGLLKFVFALLFIYGAWVAFNGAAYRWDTHDKLLPQGMLLSQGEAAYDLRYAPWVLLPTLWGERPFDFAWVRTGQWGVPVSFGLLALGCLIGIAWNTQPPLHVKKLTGTPTIVLKPLGHIPVGVSYGLPLLTFLVLVYITLRANYVDRLYWGENPELHAALQVIEEETQPPDIVFVTGREHIGFLFNYGVVRGARLVGLPFQRGEQYSPEQPPQVEIGTLDERVDPSTPPLLRAAAAQRERLWLLTEFGPFHTWARRVVEHWMAAEFYPLQVIEVAPAVRLIEYTTATPFNEQTPLDIAVNLRFGEPITLQQVTLPLGDTYHLGEALPLSFYWQTDAALDTSYTIAWFLADETNVRAQGMDSVPQMGFMPTTAWQAGISIQDNRALRIPSDLPAGTYQLWVAMYPTGTDGSQRLSVMGENTREGTIGILPIQIIVQS